VEQAFRRWEKKGGNTRPTLRGNPETLRLRRIRNAEKVTNLGRGGGLERVKPTFPVVRLWRVTAEKRKRRESPREDRVPRKTHRREGRKP